MEGKMLTTSELAKRWNGTLRTLKGWRKCGKGPKFVVLNDGGTIRYRLEDVVQYEQERTEGGK